MSDPIDVLGLGAVAVDDLIYLDGVPPARQQGPRGSPGTPRGRPHRHRARGRGPHGPSLRVRGALGDDELSRFILDGLAAEGVDTVAVVRRRCPAVPLDDPRGPEGPDPDDPLGRIGRRSAPTRRARRRPSSGRRRCCSSTTSGSRAMVRAARIARAVGHPRGGGLRAPVRGAVRRAARARRPSRGAARVRPRRSRAPPTPSRRSSGCGTTGRSAVVVTDGTNGVVVREPRAPGRVFHQPAFRVETVDTNGCGDVFHGCYAARAVRGHADGAARPVRGRGRGDQGDPARRPAGHPVESRRGPVSRGSIRGGAAEGGRMIPNQWYVVLESREVKAGQLLGVTRMGEQLVFARDRAGKAFCLRDRCAHRGAALQRRKACRRRGRVSLPRIPLRRVGAGGPDPREREERRGARALPRAGVPRARAARLAVDLVGRTAARAHPGARYFEDLDGFVWASAVDPWDAHYSRVIENQLDVVHLPFVHYNTIGQGKPHAGERPGGGAARRGPVLRAGLQRGRHRAAAPGRPARSHRRTRRSTSTSSSPTSGRTGSRRRSGSGRRSCPWMPSTRCYTCASTRSSCRARSERSSRAWPCL